MKILTKEEIKDIINGVTASLKIEGCNVSNEAVAINRQFLEGKITSKEAVKKIIQKYKSSIGGSK